MEDEREDNITDLADYCFFTIRCEQCGQQEAASTTDVDVAARQFDSRGWRFIKRKVLCPACASKV